MRKKFYELLAEREFSIEKEYTILWEFFAEEKCAVIRGQLKPLIEYIDISYFRRLPFRGSCKNIESLMSEIGLR